MGLLTPEQRTVVYLQAAERTGIHAPLLAALHQVQQRPSLVDGEAGLGISPANQVSLDQINTFAGQVQSAANTIRSLTNGLRASGWTGIDLWDASGDRYTPKFLSTIARGYLAPASDPTAARLESSNEAALLQAYRDHLITNAAGTSPSLSYLDQALLTLAERLPRYYTGLPYQRDALLELVRLWRQLDTREAAIAALNVQPSTPDPTMAAEAYLDPALMAFVQRVSRYYEAYPHQREALLRLAQRWRQLDSRDAAIASLQQDTSPESDLSVLDPALIALVQRIPQYYRYTGDHRNSLVEGFRLWQGLDTRAAALTALGVNPDIFTAANPSQADLTLAATQVDRALLDFIRRVPIDYSGTEQQRDALIRLTQLWRGLDTRELALLTLYDDLKRMARARRDSVDAPPKPIPLALLPRPSQWTPANIQIYASIVPNGTFTWAEATHGGTRMPSNQAAVDAIVQIAVWAQQARDRIGRPFFVMNWYNPVAATSRIGGVDDSRHSVGDAIDFYCDGLTGDQLYWFLDPWWAGGLGRFATLPYLCHIDARDYRVRWSR